MMLARKRATALLGQYLSPISATLALVAGTLLGFDSTKPEGVSLSCVAALLLIAAICRDVQMRRRRAHGLAQASKAMQTGAEVGMILKYFAERMELESPWRVSVFEAGR